MTVRTPVPLEADRSAEFRRLVVGTELLVPAPDGGAQPFVSLDHAASTPPFIEALAAVNRLSAWYGSVHRGAGFKAQVSSRAFEEARQRVHRFVGADPDADITIFTRNTTEALNHLAARLAFAPGQVVLVSGMEHHSNDLPWRRVARVVHVGLTLDGGVDEVDLRRKLQEHRESVRLLAITAASNVTGRINPIRRYARWVHEAGAEVVVDAAQMAAHRPLEMRAGPAEEQLDYVALSGHKMYAPFGVGALVGRRQALATGTPFLAGGGAVDVVDREQVIWTDLPDREEAGTPCVLGAVALAAAIDVLERIGWERIREQEELVTRYALRRLGRVPGLTLYGARPHDSTEDRLGVFAFNVAGLPHQLVAAILAHEWGIATRSGCFCAHPYLQHLLEIDDAWAERAREEIARGDRSRLPGAVRASFGLGTSLAEVDTLVQALGEIAAGRHRQDYLVDRATGEFAPSSAAADSFAEIVWGGPRHGG
ncbi:MAG TPA: aminotransferase class V-fold PLP-dependent enzyme [Gemmatimonadales bacterium]|nr:aminotransferase class V-fold PLP-dependent enzyme [Gemmatimonadales bacterium]